MHPTIPVQLVLPLDGAVVFSVDALLARLGAVQDQRKQRGQRYALDVLLTIAVLGRFAGHTHLAALADWARLRAPALAQLFGLPRSTMPHPATWSRILGHAVDLMTLEAVLRDFFHDQICTAEVPARGSIILAIDGKTLRGTIPAGQARGVHLIAAYLPDRGVVLAQLPVDHNANEIVVMPQLLQLIDLTGMVVVGDAMQAQRDLSTQIVAAGGDYLWTIKENQPRLRADLELLFARPRLAQGWSDPTTDFVTFRQVEKGHGRLEERTIVVSRMLRDYVDWPYLDQVFRLERVVTERGRCTSEVRYGITSLPPCVADAQRLLMVTRAEWGIENGLHWRRDVTLGEDACQVRRGHAPQVLAALNNLVIGLVRQAGGRNLAAAQRACAYAVDRQLAQLMPSATPA